MTMNFKEICPYDNCSSCNTKLDQTNTSKEHVFGKWMIKKFDLEKSSIVLMNEQHYYRRLTIPCYTQCNNGVLSKFENKISRAVSLGFKEFMKIDEIDIVSW